MTDKMNSSAEQRAQIFALLRSNAPEEVVPERPKYLDDSIADMMIGRAMSSFQTPVSMPDAVAHQASNGQNNRLLGLNEPAAERYAS